MMSLPRVLNLDKDGTLRIRALPQTAILRSGEVAKEGEHRVLRQASGEVVCVGTRGKSFEFLLGTNSSQLMHVTYSAEKHMFTTDGSQITLQPNDLPSLHAFVDGSVIELILGERIGYTKRFYYSSTTAPDVYAKVLDNEVEMKGWKIMPISPNRLTTPAHTE